MFALFFLCSCLTDIYERSSFEGLLLKFVAPFFFDMRNEFLSMCLCDMSGPTKRKIYAKYSLRSIQIKFFTVDQNLRKSLKCILTEFELPPFSRFLDNTV